MTQQNTIAVDFLQDIEVKEGYEDFFNDLMQIVEEKEIDDSLGKTLRQHVFQFLETCDLNDFQAFSDTLYKRIHLGKDFESGWEAIMMCWKKGNQTSIHGHPQFAAYNFADGKFLVEVFQEKNGELTFINSMETTAGEGFFAVGNPESFDNHIHRITCLSNTGHSLHLYSDDARKGKKFEYNG